MVCYLCVVESITVSAAFSHEVELHQRCVSPLSLIFYAPCPNQWENAFSRFRSLIQSWLRGLSRGFVSRSLEMKLQSQAGVMSQCTFSNADQEWKAKRHEVWGADIKRCSDGENCQRNDNVIWPVFTYEVSCPFTNVALNRRLSENGNTQMGWPCRRRRTARQWSWLFWGGYHYWS